MENVSLDSNLTIPHGSQVLFSPAITHIIDTLYVILTTSSLIGNISVAFLIIKRKHLHYATNTLLVNLCFCDAVAAIGFYPYIFVKDIPHHGSALYVAINCSFTDGLYIFITASICSKTTLAIISINRYYVIKYPLRLDRRLSNKAAIKISILVWIIIIPLTSYNIVTVYYSEALRACVHDYEKTSIKVYRVVMVLIALGVPYITMALCLIALHRAEKSNVCDLDERSRNIRRRTFRDPIRMNRTLIINFFICWTPFAVYYFMSAVTKAFEMTLAGQKYRHQWIRIASLFGALNGMLDMLTYFYCHKGVMHEAKATLSRFLRTLPKRQSKCHTQNGEQEPVQMSKLMGSYSL